MITNTTPEELKDVLGYESLYEVSNKGNIYSKISHKQITPWVNNRGYLCIKLYDSGHRKEWKIHQLVASAFLLDEKTWKRNEVHHKDFNKLNNQPENLEWCTRKKNMKYNYEKKKDKKSDTYKVEGPF